MSGERRYVCPECGYDGFKLFSVRSNVDACFLPGCPVCMTNDGRTVWLVETTDPRGDELAARGSHD